MFFNIVCNLLGIIENVTELRPEAAVDAGQQGILQWLLKRIRVSRRWYLLPVPLILVVALEHLYQVLLLFCVMCQIGIATFK